MITPGTLLLVSLLSSAPSEPQPWASDEDELEHSFPATRQSDSSWLRPWVHYDFSALGTPFVHFFGLEPAFLDRDMFADLRFVDTPGASETELEFEVEWALTGRLGVLLELPVARIDPDVGDTESGPGDLALGSRALLVDSDTFLLSANLELSLPTGDDGDGLGSGEAGLSPSFSAWLDLGNWVQASAQAGSGHGLESGNSELFLGAALARSFQTPPLFHESGHGPHAGDWLNPAGLLSVVAEFSGRTLLDGPDDGRDTAELLLGVTYRATHTWGARAAVQFPLGGDRDLDSALVVGVSRHL